MKKTSAVFLAIVLVCAAALIVSSAAYPASKDEAYTGYLPAGLDGTNVPITQLETPVRAETITLITDVANVDDYNNTWALSILLRPNKGSSAQLEGYYTVVEMIYGNGENRRFESSLKDGDVAVLAHSDGSLEAAGAQSLAEMSALRLGDYVYLFGVQWNTDTGRAAWKYRNACVVILPDYSEKLLGMWGSSEGVVIFYEDKTVTVNGERFDWNISAEGDLYINEVCFEWDAAGDLLVLEGTSFERLTNGDYRTLNKLISQAERLERQDYKEGFDELTEALRAAYAVVEAQYTSYHQAEIDEAAQVLSAAIDGLVEADDESDDEWDTEESLDGESSDGYWNDISYEFSFGVIPEDTTQSSSGASSAALAIVILAVILIAVLFVILVVGGLVALVILLVFKKKK